MATADPPESAFEEAGDESATDPGILAPSVLALVVTRNPGPWIADTLRSLAAQDYPALSVVVVDADSMVDPTPLVVAASPSTSVRRLRGQIGFATAANQGLEAVGTAPFLLICHDDVVLDPGALHILLEEAYRSNAGIVGPKLVRADNPDVLLEVGRTIDRFGTPHTGIEPGEIDQEQHDGVRDVFYVSSAAMLIRSDLFRELGGFDPATFPGAEDLDLCWRARLAGARVMVAPDARVRHREAAHERAQADQPDPDVVARTRIRTVLTSSSKVTLSWLVPFGLAFSLFEALVFAVTLRGGRARSALGTWWWNLRHLGELRSSRRRAQQLRRIHDRDLRELQVRSSRLRGFVTEHVATEDRVRSITDASRSAVSTASAQGRQPLALIALVLGAVYLIGSRHLIGSGVPAVGNFARWPSIRDLFDAFDSGWRYTGLGSSTPAPPVLAFMGLLGTALFGADGLARTLIVVAAIPIGAWGVFRVARPVVESSAAAGVAALAYAVNPVARNAIAAGRLGPLVLYALGPFLFGLAVRLAGFQRDRGVRRGRRLLALVVLTAVATAWFPLAPAFLILASVAMLAAALFVGGLDAAGRMLGSSVVVGALGLVLLLPWPLGYVSGGFDASALGFSLQPRLSLTEVLRFETGPAGAGWAGWGLLAAAALALLLGRGGRLAWAGRAWILALVGWALVWLPSRFAPDRSVPAPEAALTLSALGVALAVGLGFAIFVEDVRRFRFGWRQLAAVLAGIGVVLPALGFAVDSLDGRWYAPAHDWPDTLGFLSSAQSAGGFRVLWVGDPSVLPLDPVTVPGGAGYVLTADGPGDAREQWRAPTKRADDLVGEAILLASARRTDRIGHLLAPMGVRYVALPTRIGPDTGPVVEAPGGLQNALDQQIDLGRLESQSGMALYENTAWVPTRATVARSDARRVPLDVRDSTGAALRANLGRVSAVHGAVSASDPTGPGTVLWSEAFDADWKGTAGGHTLRHLKPFGWSNAYVLPERGSVSIHYEGQLIRYGAIAVEAGIWVVVVALWWRGRRRRPGRGPRAVA